MARPSLAALLVIALALAALPSTAAKEGHIKLLAVSDDSGVLRGSMADLYLSVSDGSGRVFLDTYPLTKLDTQISTRFAAEVACSLLEEDCSQRDFAYRIEAESNIVGGPSAGAATAALTAAMLAGLRVDESVALTGTINSGGLIGPVAGLKEKIEAASSAGLRLVLIPQGKRYFTSGNMTVDLVEYGGELGIEVKEVAHLQDAVYELTGKRVGREVSSLQVDENYRSIMEQLAQLLCNQTEALSATITSAAVERHNESAAMEEMANLTRRAADALSAGDLYSAASYCFGANVKARYLGLLSSGIGERSVKNAVTQTRQRIAREEAELAARDLHTITDLQTFLVVQERLDEGSGYLDEAEEHLALSQNSTEEWLDALYALAFGIERLSSAESWSFFFDSGGREYILDNSTLRKSCLEKMGEAQERLQYLQMIAPSAASAIQEDYLDAEKARLGGDFARCLFAASKSKARVNLVLTLYGQDEANLGALINNKITAVERAVFTSTQKGVFPLLGYSYLEYGKNLRGQDEGSALLYLEFAQELSNFDLYFPREQRLTMRPITVYEVLAFTIGVLLGFLVAANLKVRAEKKAVAANAPAKPERDGARPARKSRASPSKRKRS